MLTNSQFAHIPSNIGQQVNADSELIISKQLQSVLKINGWLAWISFLTGPLFISLAAEASIALCVKILDFVGQE